MSVPDIHDLFVELGRKLDLNVLNAKTFQEAWEQILLKLPDHVISQVKNIAVTDSDDILSYMQLTMIKHNRIHDGNQKT